MAPPPDLGELVRQGQEMITRTSLEHSQHWGLGMAHRWRLDQAEGRIEWSTFSTGATQ